MPKTAKHLWPAVVSFDNLLSAWHQARRGKRYAADVLRFYGKLGENLFNLQKQLLGHTWTPAPCRLFTVREPKLRLIQAPYFGDRVGLEYQARMVERGFWPTPMASDGCKGGPAQRDGRGRPYLAGAIHLWPTPKASPSGPDFAPRKRPGSGGDDLATAVARADFPATAPTSSRDAPPVQAHRNSSAGALPRNGEHGQLNPEWVEWLMGFPAGWTALRD